MTRKNSQREDRYRMIITLGGPPVTTWVPFHIFYCSSSLFDSSQASGPSRRVSLINPSVVACRNSLGRSGICVMDIFFIPRVPSQYPSRTFFMRWVLRKQLGINRQHLEPFCSTAVNSSSHVVMSQTAW